MSVRKPAEVFPPGEFLREELEARGWTQADLASILGRSQRLVNEVVTGKRSITPETAKGLSEAFETTPELWLNLQNSWELSKTAGTGAGVSRRARLYSIAPIGEMLRRGWLEPSNSIDVLEKQVLDFFEIPSLTDEPKFWPFAARKSTAYTSDTTAQRAWIVHAKHLAETIDAARFTRGSLETALEHLKPLAKDPGEIRKVPSVLAECGVRFVVVEHLKGTKIDGASFWLDTHSPVAVVSLRYDRIDAFWHTLLHELAHIKNRDSFGQKRPTIDSDLLKSPQGEDKKPRTEQLADAFAKEFLMPRKELENFVSKVRPLFSADRILGCAARLCVHPGILVGQLQFRGEISYAHSRKMLVRVRETVTQSALTDGWGHPSPLRVVAD